MENFKIENYKIKIKNNYNSKNILKLKIPIYCKVYGFKIYFEIIHQKICTLLKKLSHKYYDIILLKNSLWMVFLLIGNYLNAK